MSLDVTPQELAGVVSGLYHEIIERVLWALDGGSWFRERPIPEVQSVLNPMVTGYLKAFNLISTLGDKLDPSFLETHTISEEQWRLLDKITTADDWKDVPLG